MVKQFSVEWMAQSSTDLKNNHEDVDVLTTFRHVACMVQPRQPTSYDKDYLQPKPKPVKAIEGTTEETSTGSPSRLANCASPISEVSGYSSGYESEAALSECPSLDETSEGERDGPQRRLRTKFTPDQINKLEKIFNKNKYLDAGERIKTAQKLNLSETQVRTWFQNRRMKLKREVQDLRAEYLTPLSTVVFPQMPPIQYHDFTGQRFQYPPLQALYSIPQHDLQQPMIPHQAPYLMPSNPFY